MGERKLSLGEFGRRVAEKEGRAEPWATSTVSDWIVEKNEPRLSTFAAMAALAGGDPGWWAFGDGLAPEGVVSSPAPAEPPPGRVEVRQARVTRADEPSPYAKKKAEEEAARRQGRRRA